MAILPTHISAPPDRGETGGLESLQIQPIALPCRKRLLPVLMLNGLKDGDDQLGYVPSKQLQLKAEPR